MKLKINRYNFDVSNNDYILDNGSCYQCITLTHRQFLLRHFANMPTIMSKKQFKELRKQDIIYDDTENFRQKYPHRYEMIDFKIWRFNVGENDD